MVPTPVPPPLRGPNVLMAHATLMWSVAFSTFSTPRPSVNQKQFWKWFLHLTPAPHRRGLWAGPGGRRDVTRTAGLLGDWASN